MEYGFGRAVIIKVLGFIGTVGFQGAVAVQIGLLVAVAVLCQPVAVPVRAVAGEGIVHLAIIIQVLSAGEFIGIQGTVPVLIHKFHIRAADILPGIERHVVHHTVVIVILGIGDFIELHKAVKVLIHGGGGIGVVQDAVQILVGIIAAGHKVHLAVPIGIRLLLILDGFKDSVTVPVCALHMAEDICRAVSIQVHAQVLHGEVGQAVAVPVLALVADIGFGVPIAVHVHIPGIIAYLMAGIV